MSGTDWLGSKADEDGYRPPPDLHTDKPHPARIYDYLLGGRDNFAADREASSGITEGWPNLPKSMRANRDFLVRVTRYLAAELGFRQFVDIGTGLPTSPNLHEVAQEVAPESRILYVDNDPIVLVHARALLTSTPEGRTAYVDADLRDTDAILNSEEYREILDLDRPVALTLLAVMHYILDQGEARDIIARLMEPLPQGSALVLSTTTHISAPEEVHKGIASYNAKGIAARSMDQTEVEDLFGGLELLPPGVTLINHWHPDDAAARFIDAHVHMLGGVAIKR
ncbi:SAM-dependent methyltransferase [Saccharopolyspora sp. 5N708]|uniref:SAM-dependent methyltransferase n=1 Tax=Saccharopolyspora sp. 5N708 TaxID=3457424 RepID=UPI003FD14FD3